MMTATAIECIEKRQNNSQLHKVKKINPIPRGATHVKLTCSDSKEAVSEVKDIGWVFSYPYQCPGTLTFLKKIRGGFKELDSIDFDGVWPPKEEDDTPRLVT